MTGHAPHDEAARLRLLADYGVMDTGPDPELDEIIALASAICETPIALISLVDDTRQWFKAKLGLAAQQTPRDQAFCAHAIAAPGAALFTVPDARQDARFSANPLVTGDPNVVFYAGAPLEVEEGEKLGTLCVIDRKPRELTAAQEQALGTLSRVVVRHLQAKRALVEKGAAEARLHAVLTSIDDAVIAADASGAVSFLNPVAEQLTGWPMHKAIGAPLDSLFRLVEPETRAPIPDATVAALREGREPRGAGHSLLVRPDGSEMHIEGRAAPVSNSAGKLTGAVVTFRDVSELKKLEADRLRLMEQTASALHQADAERRRLHGLLMQTPAVIAVLRGPQHVYELVNPTYRQMIGGRDIVGLPIRAALPELAGQGLYELLDRVYASGEPFIGREVPIRLDRRGNGVPEPLFFNFVYQPLAGEDGKPEGILVFAVDVTEQLLARRSIESVAQERKLLLDARERAERELRRVFDLSRDLIATARGGRFVAMNPAVERILGWTPAEILSRPIADFTHPEDVERTALERSRSRDGGSLENFAARYRHKDGSYRWIAWNATFEGQVTYAVGRDVTDEKALEGVRARLLESQRRAREAAELATQTMDQFLATISHELRTPLTAILGWIKLVRGGQLPESKKAQALATIERNAVAQGQLISDLLDVSRIISGKMRLELEPMELVGVIEAALDVVRPGADAKGVRLEASIDPAVGEVLGDPARMQQVIWNLLSNAVKFTPKGGHVELELRRAGSDAVLVVRDSGAGIDAEFLPHVFERFRQADSASSRVFGGLGLGLSIVKKLVELHGGAVQAASEGADRGATFIVRLPRVIAAGAQADDEVAVPIASRPSRLPLAGLPLLLVEDDPDTRELMETLLQQCGAQVTAASSVAEAVQHLELTSFALIVSDLGMPKEDGYGLLRRLRALPSETSRLPIIAVTAYARDEDRVRALKAGFDAYLTKPVELDALLVEIARLLPGRSAQRQ